MSVETTDAARLAFSPHHFDTPSPRWGEETRTFYFIMETRHRYHPIILQRAREMRHPQTPAEATLWRVIRNRNLGYKFRRQHPIDRFIIDFYCAQAKLCIELDGESHLEPDQMEYDAARTEFLEYLGYKVIRFTNNDVGYTLNAVAAEIVRVIESRLNTPSPFKGEGRDEGPSTRHKRSE